MTTQQLYSRLSPMNLGHKRPTIGLFTPWLGERLGPAIWEAAQAEAQRRDVNLICFKGNQLGSHLEFENQGNILYDLGHTERLDGILFCGAFISHLISPQQKKDFCDRYQLPVVSIGQALDSIPSLLVDNAKGIHEAMAHLIEIHNRRRIVYLKGPEGEMHGEYRCAAYRQILQDYGIPLDPRWIVSMPGDAEMEWTQRCRMSTYRLLDETGLQPRRDFDAILAYNDETALHALEILRERGIRVPADVAMVGFDDSAAARVAVPPLTSVSQSISEQISQGFNLLLDWLAGRPVPDQVSVPTKLIVRSSCGCVNPAILQAAAVKPGEQQEEQVEIAVQRQAILTEMALAAGQSLEGEMLSELGQLLDAFIFEAQGGTPSLFVSKLEDILQKVGKAGGDVAAWQDSLSVMRRCILPHLKGQSLQRAEDLWQQARVTIAITAQWAQTHHAFQIEKQATVLREIGYELITMFDIPQLMATLAQGFPRLRIPSCYLALYENSQPHQDLQPAPKWSLLALAYNQADGSASQGKAAIGERRFLTHQLIPNEFWPQARRFTYVLEPLYFRQDQIGFVVFEAGSCDEIVYDILAQQIRSTLKGALLTTHNEELYQEAVHARQSAEEANRLKGRFLSTVSHELRTPLSLIIGTAKMIQQQELGNALPPKIYRDIEHIRVSAHHLFHLIGDVLDLASSQSGELELACKLLNFKEVMEDTILLGELMTQERGVMWCTDIPAALPVVWGDRMRLRQVILNLISNAVKFTEQGEVALKIMVGEKELTVLVSDTGIGIPVDEQEVIFDEFRQSERTAQRGYGGMGLGLAISRRLVELHGGQIGVRSSGEDNSGSTFYFTLPIMESVSLNEMRAGKESQTVMLLTEHTGGGQALQNHLTQRGFVVEELALDKHADWLLQIAVAPPGTVVLDLDATAREGWKLMRMLKENPATQDVPVVFYSLPEKRESGSVLELNYLAKPLGSAELAHAIARHDLTSRKSQAAQTILVVEDDPQLLNLHMRMVQAQLPGSRVVPARNGREALEMMEHTRPALVLLDLMMPEVDGFKVLEAMLRREITRDVPVIVLTAQSLTETEMARLQQGVVAVLGKGMFSSSEVLAQVEATLARSKRLGSETQRLVRQAMAYIHRHFAEQITRSDLAHHVAVNERYLTHCFQQELNVSPVSYLNRYRVRQAKGLLEKGSRSITEVALAIGFTDISYFGRVFRQEVGISPSAYQHGQRPDVT
jgi:signal transduction histidine kinase/DNA-binding LacI/PurR family transcriptional regulator/DNA-binding response OmpR family regulator